MTKLLLALTLVSVGCTGSASRLPGNGSLVLVDIEDGLGTVRIPAGGDGDIMRTAPIWDAVEVGVRYWDTVGSKFRVPEDITAEDGQPVATLAIVAASADEEKNDDRGMWFDGDDGKIHVAVEHLLANAPNGYYDYYAFVASWARFTGLSMGLKDEGQSTDVMYPVSPARLDLAPDDVAQFCKVVAPSSAACP